MAGLGSRFTEKGINVPKPLIKVSGRYMIEWALKNIQGMKKKYPKLKGVYDWEYLNAPPDKTDPSQWCKLIKEIH